MISPRRGRLLLVKLGLSWGGTCNVIERRGEVGVGFVNKERITASFSFSEYWTSLDENLRVCSRKCNTS